MSALSHEVPERHVGPPAKFQSDAKFLPQAQAQKSALYRTQAGWSTEEKKDNRDFQLLNIFLVLVYSIQPRRVATEEAIHSRL